MTPGTACTSPQNHKYSGTCHLPYPALAQINSRIIHLILLIVQDMPPDIYKKYKNDNYYNLIQKNHF